MRRDILADCLSTANPLRPWLAPKSRCIKPDQTRSNRIKPKVAASNYSAERDSKTFSRRLQTDPPEGWKIIKPAATPRENHTEMSQALKERYKFARPSDTLCRPFQGLARHPRPIPLPQADYCAPFRRSDVLGYRQCSRSACENENGVKPKTKRLKTLDWSRARYQSYLSQRPFPS